MFRLLAVTILAARRLLNPPAPGRFHDLTRLFRIAHPDADAGRWEAHADDLAEAAYWEGERRGYDRARGLDERSLRERHDWVAAAQRPALRDALRGLRDPDDPLSRLTPEERATVMRLAAEGRLASVRVTEPGED